MLEIKVTVVIPGMPEAINNLAQALTNSSVPAHPRTVQNISIETIPKTVAEQPVVVPQPNTEITPEPITAESTFLCSRHTHGSGPHARRTGKS